MKELNFQQISALQLSELQDYAVEVLDSIAEDLKQPSSRADTFDLKAQTFNVCAQNLHLDLAECSLSGQNESLAVISRAVRLLGLAQARLGVGVAKNLEQVLSVNRQRLDRIEKKKRFNSDN